MTEKDKPLSLAMVSALQAVARMKGNSMLLSSGLLMDDGPDDRHASSAEAALRQGSKPAGR